MQYFHHLWYLELDFFSVSVLLSVSKCSSSRLRGSVCGSQYNCESKHKRRWLKRVMACYARYNTSCDCLVLDLLRYKKSAYKFIVQCENLLLRHDASDQKLRNFMKK